MKLVKSLRRRKRRAPNVEKVFRGFVRALSQIRPVGARRQATSARTARSDS